MINAFATDTIDKHKESFKDENRLGMAIQRLKEVCCCCCPFTKKNTINPTKEKSSRDSPDLLITSTIPEEEGEGEEKGLSQGCFVAVCICLRSQSLELVVCSHGRKDTAVEEDEGSPLMISHE